MNHSENFVTKILNKFPLSKNSIIFDIGANRGIHTKTMSYRAQHVYAFEPAPENINVLKTNNETNITIIPKAVGNKSGKSKLYLHHLYCDMHTTQQRSAEIEEWGHSLDKFIDIDMVTIDDFIKEYNLKNVDLIKIDVEGAEEDVFRGGKETFSKMKPAVIVEIHSNVDVNWIYHFFTQMNYKFIDTSLYTVNKLRLDQHYLIIDKSLNLGHELQARLNLA